MKQTATTVIPCSLLSTEQTDRRRVTTIQCQPAWGEGEEGKREEGEKAKREKKEKGTEKGGKRERGR